MRVSEIHGSVRRSSRPQRAIPIRDERRDSLASELLVIGIALAFCFIAGSLLLAVLRFMKSGTAGFG